MHRTRSLLLLSFVAGVFGSQAAVIAGETTSEPITVGRVVTFRSEVLNETRDLEIALPDGFFETDRAYPLLVVLDGRDLFSYTVACTAVLTPNFFPEMVIVGLPNTDRRRDLDVASAGDAGSAAFRKFLETELIPYLTKHYRASGYRVILGHSLAGLFTLHTALDRPQLFDASIATSPSLSFPGADEAINKIFENADAPFPEGRLLYLSAGGEEPADLRRGIAEIEARLAGLDHTGVELHTAVFEGEGHFPIKGFYQGLRYAFDDWAPATEWFYSGTLEELDTHYRHAAAKYGGAIRPPSDLIWSLRSRLKRQEKPDEYLAATEYHVAKYPENVARHLVLANLYADRSQLDKAIETLKRGLKVDPSADKLRQRLADLQK